MSTATTNDVFRRFRTVEAKVDDKGQISLITSTDDPVEMWGWREVLLHGDKNVDTDAARSLLLNHNPNQIVGRIDSVAFSGKRGDAVATIDPDAILQTGIKVQRAVDSGALKGISIGYMYNEADCEFDDETRTVTVTRWRLLEISLTPIPADPKAGVRSIPSRFSTRAAQPAAPSQKETVMNEPVLPATVPQATPVAATPTTNLPCQRTVAMQAESLGLRASDYLGKSDAGDLMLRDAAKNRSSPVAAISSVQVDEADKIRDQAVDALIAPVLRRQIDPETGKPRGMPQRGMHSHDIARRWAGRMGIDTRSWLTEDAVDFLFDNFSTRQRRGHGQRTAETSANFTQVTALATTKLVVAGFEGYAPWSEPLVSHIETGDFKTVRTAGLALSDFNTPSEGSAFSDLTIDDATANSGTLTMGGGGLELTKQAIYNDELGLFMEKLRRIGYNGARHQDKKFVTALEAASFALATTTGALAAATLKTAWAGMCDITDPVGEKVGYLPQFLLVPNALYLTGLELTTLAQGQTAENALATNSNAQAVRNDQKMPLRVIQGRHLTSAVAWYLFADPMEASAATIVKHRDYPVPQVFEVDAGLVASRKFRIEFPLISLINFIIATKPIGAYKSTGT